MPRSELSFISRILLVLIPTIALTGCFGPRLQVLSEKLEETAVKTDGKDDYAVTYTVRVRNKGPAGRVRAMAQLFHPEGTFYSEETLFVTANDDLTLTFTFTEPTVFGSVLAGANGETKMRAVFRYESIQ
jgi:hypothetical protein